MRAGVLVVFLATPHLPGCAERAAARPAAQGEAPARDVTIVRDDWGIPHVHGKTDADAVFGLVYAQAEDDWNRIETNYLNAMGRLAEAEGEGAIVRDLRMKLFIDPDDLQAKFAVSPPFLQRLMVAWADGLNAFLADHPEVHPRVLTHLDPWMALSFSEGSIGGDIETVSLDGLAAFYGAPTAQHAHAGVTADEEPTGSNGFAIAGSRTASGKPMLLINPHTSFFFRAEVQVTSDEGLNAYGAVTWGQFFVYQGWNTRAAWMHTSSGVDAIDEYAETVVKKGARLTYRYGTEERAVIARVVRVPYRTASGMQTKTFTVYATHHGPVVRREGDAWITVRLMNDPVGALTQSFIRTKATSYAAFRRAMELHANSSNNTVFADADGTIAYDHPSFIPRRDARFDWSRPVDGSDPRTEWQGLHALGESISIRNPPNGWLQNTNDWPFSAAGENSPKQADFPAYMDRAGETPRGFHALRVLGALAGGGSTTLESLVAAAYDTYLTGFERLLPALFRDYDALAGADASKRALAEPIAALRGWDLRYSLTSVPTTLAVFWGDELWQVLEADAKARRAPVFEHIATRATPAQRIAAFAAATEKLTKGFGSWKVAWGDVNRLQRLTGDIVQPFDDGKPSIPVAFTSGRWGSLASFGAATAPGTTKLYGTSGNSFVAVVELGDRVRARAVTVGGESGDPRSKHFGDQSERYAAGALREVYFHPDQLPGHVERTYRPGRAPSTARGSK